MAAEPIMLLARTADHPAVARRLRELVPGVRIDGADADWRQAVATFGRWWKKRTITFNYDPDYHAEPNWSTQMNGLRGYLDRFPHTERKTVAVLLPTTFRYGLAVQMDPEPAGWVDAGGDPRLDVLYAVAEMLDGVVFTPSALRDARGRVLFGAGGAAAEDPRAAWPAVIAAVRVPARSGAEDDRPEQDENGEDDEEEGAEAPSAERVARRALALAAVSARGVAERYAGQSGATRMHQDLLAWVDQAGLADELEPDELEMLREPPGRLDPQAAVNAVWRVEGLAVLAWALGRFQLPPHDEPSHPDDVWSAMRLMDADGARALAAEAVLRPRDELQAMRERLFALHWRLRDFRLRARAMDFAEFARTCWFGPLDITGVPLVDGDLAIGGSRIDRADPDVLGRTQSAAQERHLAANWLWEGPALYSEADAST
ncbi:MAG TPA: DUF4272 domain-containing protein [Longimicrobium sp.]|nr:DUF4272 domain-containing protein [Longimicrobium sp.]